MVRDSRFVGAHAAALLAAFLLAPCVSAAAAEDAALAYRDRVQPILAQYCFGCHGEGAAEGEVSLDAAEVGDDLYGNVTLWSRVLRNVRGDIMPPAGEPRPTAEEEAVLADWIKGEVYGIDAANPDPGRVTIRRLNRSEYGNTIRALMGVDFDAEFLFPPDDSGYGFDNNGDVLSLSPMLMEKYMQAAEEVVEQAVPAVSLQAPERSIPGEELRAAKGRGDGRMLKLDEPADVRHTIDIPEEGDYRVELTLKEDGSFEYVTSRAMTAFLVDGRQAHAAEHVWEENKRFVYNRDYHWKPGPHTFGYVVTPLPPIATGPTQDDEGSISEEEEGYANIEIVEIKIVGPLDPAKRVAPPNYARFFPRPLPPTDPAERKAYAREVLEKFATRSFRRPVDDATLDRLVAIAETSFADPDRTFEQGIQDAMTAALASSRFLFRQESPAASDAAAKHPLVDEFSLASRLSYFLWGTAPDDQLYDLAKAGTLRENLPQQVARLRRDPRSRTMLRNFVDQWLRARDVETVPLDTLAILGLDKEFTELRAKIRARGFNRRGEGPDPLRERFVELRERMMTVDTNLRTAMRQETELHFEYIVENDRSLLELVDCNYAFLNNNLARFYGLPKVEGDNLRRVELPADSVRGGVLTQGTALLVTSNPTRTSPVKRGLYVLDNLLGTPPPPPPPVPALEEAADQFEGRDPPLRELLAAHRASPLCASCHNRMDPLGLALENFDALGQWRTTDGDATIDPAGQLVSGEEFSDLAELKKILVGPRRLDFYRCVTEKLMTFALGRGVEPQDQQTIDEIVEKLEESGGKFQVLLDGLINSPQFQRMRRPDADSVAAG